MATRTFFFLLSQLNKRAVDGTWNNLDIKTFLIVMGHDYARPQLNKGAVVGTSYNIYFPTIYVQLLCAICLCDDDAAVCWLVEFHINGGRRLALCAILLCDDNVSRRLCAHINAGGRLLVC